MKTNWTVKTNCLHTKISRSFAHLKAYAESFFTDAVRPIYFCHYQRDSFKSHTVSPDKEIKHVTAHI